MEKVAHGLFGEVAGYRVVILGDRMTVGTPAGETVQQDACDLADFVATHTGLKLGWTRTEDFETVSVYDPADGNFGYTVNVTYGEGEWGYCYFGAAS